MALLHPFASQAGLVINEFYPDPSGTDSGREFVELQCTGSQVFDLFGVSLEFANGTQGAVWSGRWTCEEHLTLAPGQRFLLVDRNWLGDSVGDVEVWLGLQNGPDAIRLVQGGVQLDLVGYGPLTDPEMMEGNPAPMVSGQTVARRPDGQDTQNNAADFVTANPTPGGPNFLPFDVELLAMGASPWALDRAGFSVQLTMILGNTGTEALPTGMVALMAFGQRHTTILDGFGSGQERQLVFIATPAQAGRWPLELLLPVGSSPDTLRLSCGAFQVGPGSLIINEILAAPAAGQGEWVEILNRGEEPVDLGSYQVRDEDGTWLALPMNVLFPGEYLVLAQDQILLAGWHFANFEQGLAGDCAASEIADRFLELPASWPNLNNSPPASRVFADRLYLADSTGIVVDVVTLGAPEQVSPEAGVSWERLVESPHLHTGENWAPSTSLAMGTPGCRNSVAVSQAPQENLTIAPKTLDPVAGITTVHLGFELIEPAFGWRLQIFDTWGDQVRDMGSRLDGPGPRDLIWNGMDDQGNPVDQGAYIALLEHRNEAGGVLFSEKGLILVRRDPRP